MLPENKHLLVIIVIRLLALRVTAIMVSTANAAATTATNSLTHHQMPLILFSTTIVLHCYAYHGHRRHFCF